MKTTAALLALFAVLLCLCGPARADENNARKIIQRAKAATALVQTEGRISATAFCIEPSGWFITNRHVFDKAEVGSETTLILNPGELDEKVTTAKIVRSDDAVDLVLLQAKGADFTFLAIGGDEELFETMRVTAFGYPFGRALADKDDYPNVTVTSGRITALRKKDGMLENIQLDNSLNPGNSGGPVIDTEGNVIGIVRAGIRGSGVNFAIPVSDLKKMLARPVIKFDTTEIGEVASHAEQALSIQVTSLKPPPDDRSVELEITVGDAKPKHIAASGGKNGAYEARIVLIPAKDAPDWLQVEVHFAEGSIVGRIADEEMNIGEDTLRLRDIHRIEATSENEPPKIIVDGKVLRGDLNSLRKTKVDFGNTQSRVDLTKARRLTISPITTKLPEVHYRVLVRDGDKIVGEQTGRITITAAPQAVRHVEPPAEITKITPPNLESDKTIVKLPAPIDQVVVGASGRLLILHLKKLQQLAIFDVSQAKVVKYLPLPSNDITYAAGANKLFVGLRDIRVIQRWDLKTLQRELTVDAPEGGLSAMAMGAAANAPLIVLATQGAKRSYLIDPTTMKAEPVQWKGWKGGAWGPVHVHVSFDGSTAVVCGGGWAGIEVASLMDGKITNSEPGSYVHGDTLIAGNGALVFPNEGGIVRRDLASNAKGIEGEPFPAIGPAFSLAFEKRDNKPTLTIFGNNDPQRIATVRDLSELAVNSSLPIHQRVFLIPRADVLITVGEGTDRLLLRRFDLEQSLADEGIDYLFVESAPPTRVRLGSDYRYPIQVRSRKKGVKISLQAGPEGMAIAADGVLTWKVPSDYQGKQSPVIVAVTDNSGQQVFHSFRLNIEH